MEVGGGMDPSGGDSTGDRQVGLSEQEKIRQAVDIALRSVGAMILMTAARYDDPTERDYRDGMRQAARLVEDALGRYGQ
jgi:hypothetical protein